MNYFITGASGFIGKRLVRKLLERDGSEEIYFLVRRLRPMPSPQLREYWGVDESRAIPVVGDLTATARCQRRRQEEAQQEDHALFPPRSNLRPQGGCRIAAARQRRRYAQHGAVCGGHWQALPPVPVRSLLAGLFEACSVKTCSKKPRNSTIPTSAPSTIRKAIVRRRMPWRIYRPAIVVGDFAYRRDGQDRRPLLLLPLIQKMRKMLPPWMPTIGLEGGRINVVPVDFVVAAVDHIAHLKNEDGKCFHLVDPTPMRWRSAQHHRPCRPHAPEMALRINAACSASSRQHAQGLMALTRYAAFAMRS